MPNADLSDEGLVKSGNITTAIAVLFQKYNEPLYGYIYKLSWNKTDDFVRDVLQATFTAFLEKLRNGKFKPAGSGTVKAYIYNIASYTTMAMNRKEGHQPKTQEAETWNKLMDELDGDIMSSQTAQKKLDNQLEEANQVLNNLAPEDRKLMLLYCSNKSYQEIQKEPEFKNIKLPALRRRICDLKEKLNEEFSRKKDKEV